MKRAFLTSPDQRITEAEINAEFEEAHLRILGALFEIVSRGLRRLPGLIMKKLPRMAGFALWVTACEEALEWKLGTFINEFAQARQAIIVAALESEAIFEPLGKLAKQGFWEGKATELYNKL
jgi:hypothetical protein